jgi:hypothetical protein
LRGRPRRQEMNMGLLWTILVAALIIAVVLWLVRRA